MYGDHSATWWSEASTDLPDSTWQENIMIISRVMGLKSTQLNWLLGKTKTKLI
jgi:hypothetical protein